MTIRDVQLDDFPALAALTNHYILTTPIHFGYGPVSADELRHLWESHPKHPYLVMTEESQESPRRAALLGYAKAAVWRERAAYSRTAEVGIYLDPSAHGRGLGKTLYRALIDRCRAAGYHCLVGGLTLPNPASARLHEACGFVHVGTFRQVGWKFAAWHDVAFYQLML
ncbi:GNAT family N-acetyltransferase [soil metagenome]